MHYTLNIHKRIHALLSFYLCVIKGIIQHKVIMVHWFINYSFYQEIKDIRKFLFVNNKNLNVVQNL